ncbi:MAG: type II toxin-antitoxin system ParD family antitoxin [Nodosilinea sp.]
MEITLTPEVEQYIQSKITSGQYASASEVFLTGIQLLQDIEKIYQGRYQALRDDVRIGLDASEKGEVMDADVVFSQLQERLNQKRNQTP